MKKSEANFSWGTTYRVDSGEYRILFSLDETAKVITIIRVRHRKHVYRNL